MQVLPPTLNHHGILIPVEDEDNSLSSFSSIATHLFLDDVMRNKLLFPLQDLDPLWPTPMHGWAAMMIGGRTDPCTDSDDSNTPNNSESSCNALPRATTTWGDAFPHGPDTPEADELTAEETIERLCLAGLAAHTIEVSTVGHF